MRWRENCPDHGPRAVLSLALGGLRGAPGIGVDIAADPDTEPDLRGVPSWVYFADPRLRRCTSAAPPDGLPCVRGWLHAGTCIDRFHVGLP